MMNCLFLVLYSMPSVLPGSIFLLTANGFGAVMHLAYLIILLLYTTDNKDRIYIGGAVLIELAVVGLVGGLVIGLAHTILMRRVIIGVFCFLCATMGYYPHLYYVVAERADYLPYTVPVTNTLIDLCWMIYVSIRFDPTLWFAYLSRFFLGVVHLTQYGKYLEWPLKFSDVKELATADVQLQGIVIVDAHKKLVREHVQTHLQQIEKCDDKKLATGAAGPGIVVV